ncbi:MAG: GTP 3',8-cyclase MoaA [Phycisphaerae bacterium]
MLRDAHGRSIAYLRLSLTKNCSMRCLYCRPETSQNQPDQDMLTPHEIAQLVAHLCTHHGVTKVRLTGGEPTSRRDLVEIITRLAALGTIRDLALTTNGLTLPHQAQAYAQAGLHRVNISLDSLNPERFAALTGVAGLPRVLEGIRTAQRVGLSPIRINTVVVRGQNESDLPSLLEFAADHGLEIRFIELMPMGPLADRWADLYVPESAMRQILDPHVVTWTALPHQHESARRYRVLLASGGQATVGFITAMSCNFCDSCNRIRIGSDGAFYPCLMDRPAAGGGLLPAIRPVFNGAELDRLIAAGLDHKAAAHGTSGFVTMTHIGG